MNQNDISEIIYRVSEQGVDIFFILLSIVVLFVWTLFVKYKKSLKYDLVVKCKFGLFFLTAFYALMISTQIINHKDDKELSLLLNNDDTVELTGVLNILEVIGSSEYVKIGEDKLDRYEVNKRNYKRGCWSGFFKNTSLVDGKSIIKVNYINYPDLSYKPIKYGGGKADYICILNVERLN